MSAIILFSTNKISLDILLPAKHHYLYIIESFYDSDTVDTSFSSIQIDNIYAKIRALGKFKPEPQHQYSWH